MKNLTAIVILTAGILTSQAQSTFQATLDGAQDGGGARQGTGSGSFVLTGHDLSYNVSWSGLSSTATAGHIHGPAPAGTPAGVLFPLSGVSGVSGSVSGTVTGMTDQQVGFLNDGLLYVNIHDSVFPGGEIRGQIVAVPEPAALGLLAIGGLSLWALRRKSSV